MAQPDARAAPTERGWWEAAEQTWTRPAEWSAWHVASLAGLLVLQAFAAFWVTRPGSPLGGAEALNAAEVYTSAAEGRYVYELLEPPAGRVRMRATLQALYDAHRAAAPDGRLDIVLLRRNAPPGPYVAGTGDPTGAGVVGRVVVGRDQRDAAVRRAADAPLERVSLNW